MRLQVGLGADAGNLGGHVEDRMGDLAGDHVDLVVECHGDDHVGLICAGLGENIGMSAMTDIAADIERVTDGLDQRRRRVDNRDVVVLGCKPLGDAVTYPPRAADDDLHCRPL
jgi:hypothetical protein